MSQTGYSKYETGENDVPTHILLKLAGFLSDQRRLSFGTHGPAEGVSTGAKQGGVRRGRPTLTGQSTDRSLWEIDTCPNFFARGDSDKCEESCCDFFS